MHPQHTPLHTLRSRTISSTSRSWPSGSSKGAQVGEAAVRPCACICLILGCACVSVLTGPIVPSTVLCNLSMHLHRRPPVSGHRAHGGLRQCHGRAPLTRALHEGGSGIGACLGILAKAVGVYCSHHASACTTAANAHRINMPYLEHYTLRCSCSHSRSLTNLPPQYTLLPSPRSRPASTASYCHPLSPR